MNTTRHCPSPPGLFGTVRLLLRSAQRRARGRKQRQNELLRHRSGKLNTGKTLNWFAGSMVLLLAVLVQMIVGLILQGFVERAQEFEVERTGRIVVGSKFLNVVRDSESSKGLSPTGVRAFKEDLQRRLEPLYAEEAKRRTEEHGGTNESNKAYLQGTVDRYGSAVFVDRRSAAPGITAGVKLDHFPAFIGSIVLLWWFVMMVFQGEGLELDLQRRRHPMWEWLASHPVSPAAIFMAEMLAPIASNLQYCASPVFFGYLYGSIYGGRLGLLATLVVGVPFAIATACVGKALEIAVMLRFSPRSRGAVLGIMSWTGYASFILLIFGMMGLPRLVSIIGAQLYALIDWLPCSFLIWVVGGQADGSSSLLSGFVVCWILASAMIACAVAFCAWGAKRGMDGGFKGELRPAKARRPRSFGREPLYRKELLWFVRDRSAIVQTILIPITIASVQLFNLRGLRAFDVSGSIEKGLQTEWNYICGAAIVFGTYFLWVLGPKSLTSEGAAIWLAQTWPRGLESLLKAKAWLWSMIASGIVVIILAYAAVQFRNDAWKIALVGVGWFAFARSMAEKTVTLVTVTSSTGEADPVPRGRRLAASFGLLTFGIEILSGQWQLAVVGIVYSWVTAAAMWQNFRARLPYLYDPWSEKLPTPPTVMHAMIAISALVELGAVITALFTRSVTAGQIALARTVLYALSAAVVALSVARFMASRGVPFRQLCYWEASGDDRHTRSDGRHGIRKLLAATCIAIAGGLLLALFAHGYIDLLLRYPELAEMIHASRARMDTLDGGLIYYAVTAVVIAPCAEEYLFRGLLFRSLDREWGGWKAIAGSAAFFAIYHPPLAWIPVGLLGISSAILFKNSRLLVPSIVLHMTYNAALLL
jgi:membrane protease YdiL (CAAX protease family)